MKYSAYMSTICSASSISLGASTLPIASFKEIKEEQRIVMESLYLGKVTVMFVYESRTGLVFSFIAIFVFSFKVCRIWQFTSNGGDWLK